MSKDMDFCRLREIYLTNMEKNIGYYYKNRTGCSKKVFDKTVEATGELIRDKVSEKIVKPKPVSDVNSRNVADTVIQPEKPEEIISEVGQVL